MLAIHFPFIPPHAQACYTETGDCAHSKYREKKTYIAYICVFLDNDFFVLYGCL